MTFATLVDVSEKIARRLGGPAHLCFIIQPLIATALGIRDGVTDAKAGVPPYLLASSSIGSIGGNASKAASGLSQNLSW